MEVQRHGVKVQLTSAVSLILAVEEGSTVKQVREALAVLGSLKNGNIFLSSDSKVLPNDADVPPTVTLTREDPRPKSSSTRSFSAKLKGPSVQSTVSPGKDQNAEKSVLSRLTRPSTSSPAKDREKKLAQSAPSLRRVSASASTPSRKPETPEASQSKSNPRHRESLSRQNTVSNTPTKGPPELEEARAKLLKVTAPEVRKIASMGSPPALLVRLMEHIMLALGASNKSWEAACHELSDMKFMRKLSKVEASFPDKVLRKLETYTTSSEFQEDEIKKVAGNAGVGLMGWMVAAVSAAKSKESCSPSESPRKRPDLAQRRVETAETRSKSHPQVDSSEATRLLAASSAELASLKKADFREYRVFSNMTPPKEVSCPLAAMQAALGKKDTSVESALKMLLNPASFVKQLVDAANDPEAHLRLRNRSEFLILQKFVTNPAMNQPKESSLTTLPAIVRWVKAAYTFSCRYHKHSTVVKDEKQTSGPEPNGAMTKGREPKEAEKGEPEEETKQELKEDVQDKSTKEPKEIPVDETKEEVKEEVQEVVKEEKEEETKEEVDQPAAEVQVKVEEEVAQAPQEKSTAELGAAVQNPTETEEIAAGEVGQPVAIQGQVEGRAEKQEEKAVEQPKDLENASEASSSETPKKQDSSHDSETEDTAQPSAAPPAEFDETY